MQLRRPWFVQTRSDTEEIALMESNPQNSDATEGTAADRSRSGDNIAEAVERAVAGTPEEDVLTPPTGQDQPGGAPVEHVRGDAAMTEGQVVTGPGTPASSPGPSPAGTGSSGGAQSQVGGRVSDRLAGGEPQPEGEPFTENG